MTASHHVVQLKLKRRPWIVRTWAVLARHEVRTEAQSPLRREQWLAIFVPYRFRGFHEKVATRNGYFWSPCPLCDQPFGGHEWRHVGGRPHSVPDPMLGPGSHTGICPRCTRRGRGVS